MNNNHPLIKLNKLKALRYHHYIIPRRFFSMRNHLHERYHGGLCPGVDSGIRCEGIACIDCLLGGPAYEYYAERRELIRELIRCIGDTPNF